MKSKRWRSVLFVLWLPILGLAAWGNDGDEKKDSESHASENQDEHHSSRLTSKKIPLQLDAVPKRPKPIFEWGEPFLGTGTLSPGFQLPTGAVWQPTLIGFGTIRTALQSNGFDPIDGDSRTTELAARLDLFANLQLSGSERLVLGLRSLDQDGRFTSYVFDSQAGGRGEGGQEELNTEIGTLFFEGEIGEIFPNFSPNDFKPTDIGFSVGRQPIFFQEGILINDTLDGVGLTWNSLQPRNTSNFRTTFLYAWNNVDRNNINLDSGDLFALFNAFDFSWSTMEFDVVYNSGGDSYQDLMGFGISAIQRIGNTNSSFRILGSSLGDDGLLNEADDSDDSGLLFFSELGWTPHRTYDFLYLTSFWAIDTFTPVAMGPADGGPLGRAGINFASVGLGNYSAPLSASATSVAGGALGYQIFSPDTRRQWLFELAARVGTKNNISDAYAATVRYQMAMGRRFVLVFDGYANYLEAFDRDTFYGGRVEFQTRL